MDLFVLAKVVGEVSLEVRCKAALSTSALVEVSQLESGEHGLVRGVGLHSDHVRWTNKV